LSLVGAATAGATITKTSVTTPGNPFYAPAWNSDAGATNPNFTIAGTSDGTAGDAVDVICVYGGNNYNMFATNVPVNADGTWSISTNASGPNDSTCTIRAIPHATSFTIPADQSPFTGPFSTFSYFYDSMVGGSGPNSATQYDYFADMWGQHGHAEMYSSGSDGLEYQYSLYPNGNAGGYGWYISAYLPTYDYVTGTRGSIQVDGHDAFNSYGASYVWNENPNFSYNNTGLPPLSFGMAVQSSGNNFSIEGEQLVTCPPSATYPYGSGNCASFSNSNVQFQRTVLQAAQGELTYITDTLTSTDGNSHMVNLRYNENYGSSSRAQFAFPGDVGLNPYSSGDVRGGPFPAQGTVWATPDYRYPTSVQYPAGSLTWNTAPDQARFSGCCGNVSDFVFDYLKRTVPASGSLTLRFAFVTASNDADNASLTAAARSAFTPPPPAPPAPPAKPAPKPAPAPAPAIVARKCIVPKIAKGMKLAVAENKIQAAECIVGRVAKVHSKKIKKGRVVSQTVAAGTAVPFGSPVGLAVSSGPAHAKHGKK
jgi:hypothetical protein